MKFLLHQVELRDCWEIPDVGTPAIIVAIDIITAFYNGAADENGTRQSQQTVKTARSLMLPDTRLAASLFRNKAGELRQRVIQLGPQWELRVMPVMEAIIARIRSIDENACPPGQGLFLSVVADGVVKVKN
jgi:hypothetical protein